MRSATCPPDSTPPIQGELSVPENYPAFLTLDVADIRPSTVLEHILKQRAAFFNHTHSSPCSSGTAALQSEYSVSQVSGRWVNRMTSPINRIVRSRLTDICEQLGLPHFKAGHIQSKCIAFRDGGSFKPHIDIHRESNLAAQRKITWVYYVHREPRPFTGGNLVFYSRRTVVGEIEPITGTLLIFRSDTLHEVKPVQILTGEFADCRFVLTGFVYDAPTAATRVTCAMKKAWKRLPLPARTRRRISSAARRVSSRFYSIPGRS